MNRSHPTTGAAGRARPAARIALVALGLCAAWAANAANCSDAPVSGRAYYIVNKDSGLQLDVFRGSQDAGAAVIQWSARSSANQQWTLDALSTGIWTMRAAHSKQALDLSGWSSAEDAPIKQYTYSGNQNQQWLLTKNGDAYTIASNFSKKLLTVANKSAGTALKQHSDLKGSGLQRWYFNPVDGKCSSGSTATWGSFLGFDRILIGGELDEKGNNASNTTDTINKAPWDLRYSYIHSRTAPKASCYTKCTPECNSAPGGKWWGCWRMSGDGKWETDPGSTITYTNNNNANSYKYDGQPHRMIHQWTWYSGEDLGKMQKEINKAAGRDGDKRDWRGAINNPTLLKGYIDDYRLFLKKIGNEKNIIHLEPDFWGFIRVSDGDHPNDPHKIPAAVTSAVDAKECPNAENSAAGLASCLITMAKSIAKNSAVGLHFTCWDRTENSTNRGLQACIKYYRALGAGQGDMLVTDATDRDAEWAANPKNGVTGGKAYWWDDAAFDTYLADMKTVAEAFGKPMIIWQIPLGNEWQNGTDNHYRDDKVKHFFSKIDKVAAAHIVALQFGPGETHQTYSETDGGYLLKHALEYYKKGGQKLK